jgi:nucleotide-binding universal stress UspA family protein
VDQMPLEKFLVPVDGSDGSVRAVLFASTMAKKFQAKVTLLHVVPSLVGMIAGPESFVNIDTRPYEESGRRILEKAAKILEFSGLTVETRLEHGQPVDTIVRLAKNEGFDLIILGNRGLSPVRSLLLGSVSNGVSHHAKCPVLIVR